MPNTFAYLVLFSWPLVVFVLFRRLPIPNALAWSIIAGYLLLPEQTGIDFPMLPPLNKTFIPAVTAGVMCLVLASQSRKINPTRLKFTVPEDFVVLRGRGIFWVLLGLLFMSPVVTFMQNKEPLIYGARYIQGLRVYDIAAMNLNLGVAILPFLLARRYLASERSHLLLLKILVIAALGYGFLALYEIRMSPQLSRMVYGFFPHSFAQHIRGDGFRPLVFLNHGLLLAIYLAMAILAAFTLWRASSSRRVTKWLLAGFWLMLVLLLSHSLGALIIALLLAPSLLFLKERSQILLAMIIAGTVLVYPMLRGAGYVPVNSAYTIAQSINEDRAGSLKYRFDNEDILLQKAMQKPLVGWGGWGRSRVYNEAGRDISVTDGIWVITIGTYGWLGYVAQFGLLCIPTLMLGWHRKRLNISRTTTGLALVLGATLLDLLVNASLTPVTWLIAGAIMGHYQIVNKASSERLDPSGSHVHKRAEAESAYPQRCEGRSQHQRKPRVFKNE